MAQRKVFLKTESGTTEIAANTDMRVKYSKVYSNLTKELTCELCGGIADKIVYATFYEQIGYRGKDQEHDLVRKVRNVHCAYDHAGN